MPLFTLHTKKRCLFFKSDCHILQMMKSDPFVQCSQYLHQLQYDVNVNTVLTDDNRMILLDLIIAFRQSCVNNSDPSHHRVVQGFVVSDLLERLWCFESNGFKTVFVFALSVHVCVFCIYNMDVLAFSLSSSGATDSTSHTIRVRTASSSSLKPMSWRRNGWSSLAWHCECFVVSEGLHCTVLFFRFVICLDNRHKSVI